MSSGDEQVATADAARTAGRVARLTEERTAFDRREAKRSSAAAIADVDRVDAADDKTAAATELTSYAQGLALGRIAVDTAVQVAHQRGLSAAPLTPAGAAPIGRSGPR